MVARLDAVKQPDWSARNRRIVVLGPSGSGKSSWLQCFLAGWRGRVLAFDHKGEFGARYRFPVCSHAAQLPECLAAGRVAFNPQKEFEGCMAKGFEFCAAMAFSLAKRLPGETLFACDELQDWIGTGRKEMPAALGKVLESGRCYGLSSVALAQASNLVNCRLRQQFTEVVVFRQTEARALKFLDGAGLDTEAIGRLDKLHFTHVNLESGQSKSGRIAFQSGRPVIVSLSAKEPR